MLGRPVPKPWSTPCGEPLLTNTLGLEPLKSDMPRHRIARYCRLRRQDIGPTRRAARFLSLLDKLQRNLAALDAQAKLGGDFVLLLSASSLELFGVQMLFGSSFRKGNGQIASKTASQIAGHPVSCLVQTPSCQTYQSFLTCSQQRCYGVEGRNWLAGGAFQGFWEGDWLAQNMSFQQLENLLSPGALAAPAQCLAAAGESRGAAESVSALRATGGALPFARPAAPQQSAVGLHGGGGAWRG